MLKYTPDMGDVVKTIVEETYVDSHYGPSWSTRNYVQEGLTVTCRKCGHTVEVFGTEGPSMRRAGVMLREECPRGLKNFYVVDGGEDWPSMNEAEVLEAEAAGLIPPRKLDD